MKKVLLAMMAAAAVTAPVNAQQLEVTSVEQTAFKARTNNGLNAINHNLLNKFSQENLKLVNEGAMVRTSRAGVADEPIDPKVMSLRSGYDREMLNLGLQLKEAGVTYKVASMFGSVGDRFAGNKITKIRVFMGPSSKDLTPFILNANTGEEVWKGKKSSTTTLSKGKIVEVPCDYTLVDSIPVVVGYQVTAKSTDIKLGGVIYNGQSGLLFAMGDNYKFMDLAGNNNLPVAAFIECKTEGPAGLKANDAQAVTVVGGRLNTNELYETAGVLVNYGCDTLKSAKISYKVGDETIVQTIDTLNLPYLAGAQVNIKATSPNKGARYIQNFNIDEVNGKADEFTAYNDNLIQNLMIVTEKNYNRVAVMEEFTGTWCGYCPRGTVAIEKAEKELGDKFIGIAVHVSGQTPDQMETKSYLPLVYKFVPGFPSAMINRIGFSCVDPYYGMHMPANQNSHHSADGKGIVDDLKTIIQSTGEANVGLSSSYDEENNSIDVTTTMKFGLDAEGRDYSVAYVLMEDSVTGVGAQTNYFHSSVGMVTSEDQLPDDLKHLYTAGNRGYLMDPFNHVARNIHDVAGIQGSLDGQTIKTGKNLVHNYSIPVPLSVKNVDKLSVAVLLIDNVSQEIVTGCHVKLGESYWNDEPTAVESIKADVAKISVANGMINVSGKGQMSVYSVDGKLVEQVQLQGTATVAPAQKGAYIVRVVNGNSITVKKVML